jgi:hypothetical protein
LQKNQKHKFSFNPIYKAESIQLPIKRGKDHSYTILDATDAQIFISINHGDDNSKVANVYISDFRDFKFILSLINVVRDEIGNVDFEKAESIYRY